MSGSRTPWVLGVLVLLAAGLAFGVDGLSTRAFQPRDLAWSGVGLALWLLLSFLPLREAPRVPLALTVVLTLLPTLWAARTLDTTVTNDEQAYLLQAELFASGHLSEPLPQPSCERIGSAFSGLCPLHLRQVFEDPERGVRFSKYPPGTSLVLAPFAPWGGELFAVGLAGVLSVILVFVIARDHGASRPDIAAFGFALCPFFWTVQTSVQSEVFSAPALLAGYVCLLRASRSPAFGLGVGAAAGWIFLARPLTGLALALACVPALLRAGRRAQLAAVLAGLPFLALYLAYNHAQTGTWGTSPYELYASAFGPFEQGQAVDVYGKGDALRGLAEQLGRWSLAVFGLLGVGALGLVGAWRLRGKDTGAALLIVLLGVGLYAFHWYAGHWAYAGPLYGFEALGLMVVVACILLEKSSVRAHRALPWSLIVAAALLTTDRLGRIEAHVNERAEPARLAAQHPDAVIFLPSDERGLKLYAPSRPPFAGSVLLRDVQKPETIRAVLERLGLGERRVYDFARGEVVGSGRLVPRDL